MNINVSIRENNDIEKEDDKDKKSISKEKISFNIFLAKMIIEKLTMIKKKNIDINYFISYINVFNDIKKELLNDDTTKVLDKLDEIDYIKPKMEVFGDKQIEPYNKKQFICFDKFHFINKYNFHNSIQKIESKYYEFVNFIYDKFKDPIGYIVIGKKAKKSTKNLYFVIDRNYEKNFYAKITKEICIISEIANEFNIYEKTIYSEYLKYFRDYLFSVLYEVMNQYQNINNIVFIGNKRGGNILDLFLKDILENFVSDNVPEQAYKMQDISYNIFKMNNSMLTNINFYEDINKLLANENYTYINCFDNKSLDYKTWAEYIRYYRNNDNVNTIVLEKITSRRKKKDAERIEAEA